MNPESPHSPFSAAAAILASDTPLSSIAAELKLPLPDLVKILRSPDAQSLIAAIIHIDTQRADHREQRSRLTALSTLESVCTDPASDPVEKRRAAAAILAKNRPASRGCHGSSGSDASRASRRQPASTTPPHPDDQADDADLDHDDIDDGADGRGNRVPKPLPPWHRPKPIPQLPLDATPDQVVERQLSLIQAIDKPAPLTPRDIVHAIDFHRLAFPNRYYAAKAIAFQQALEGNPLLNSPGATLTADPATLHDTIPPTATIRVTINRPPDPHPAPPDAQCLMPDASSCLFHLIHESTFFPQPDSPHAWHTKSITRDTS